MFACCIVINLRCPQQLSGYIFLYLRADERTAAAPSASREGSEDRLNVRLSHRQPLATDHCYGVLTHFVGLHEAHNLKRAIALSQR